MPSFFLALLLSALAALGGREAVRVARLAAGLGQATGLLAACWLAAITGMVLAAWLGAGVAQYLHPDAKGMLLALALVMAAVELLMIGPGRKPLEPTRSFGAIVLVLAAGQLTGSGGFVVFALAGKAGIPALAAAGGAVGAGAVLTAAWAAGEEWETKLPLIALRYGLAAALALAGVLTGLSARGLLG